MNWWTNTVATEHEIIAEIQKGWAELEAGVQKVTIDVKKIFDYIAAHQTAIDNTAQAILSNVSMLAALAGHPEVGAVAAGITMSAKAIADVAAGIDKGSIALPDLVGALHGVKNAQTAVNALVVLATTKPAPVAAP